MLILQNIFFIVAGLLLLVFGGNTLIDGAVSLAKKFRLSEAVIGLTIVAVGTSMPELIVSLVAALQGSTEIAIANVLGSNISNFFLVLGIGVIISPVIMNRQTRFFDLPMVMLATILLLIFVSDVFFHDGMMNIIGHVDGIVFMIAAFLYILYSVKHGTFTPEDTETVTDDMPLLKSVFWIAGGIFVLFLGGKWLVDSSVVLAHMIGLSERVIGLTIVAIGTSMPELVTTIIAARRGKSEIAVGNIIGSNIMNIFVILGVTAFITPIPFFQTSYIDLLMALLAPILVILATFITPRGQIARKEGIIFVLIYVIYMAYILTT